MTISIMTMIGIVTALILSHAWIRRYLNDIDEELAFFVLQGFVVKLIREMENNPRTTSGRQKDGRMSTLTEIAALAPKDQPPPSILATSGPLPERTDPVSLGREVVGWNEEMASKFWKGAQGVRNGALIALLLFRDSNVGAAAHMLREHLEQKRPQRYADLQDLFQLDRKRGMTRRRLRSIHSVIKRRDEVFRGLDFKPFDEEKVYEGVDILMGARNFTR